MRHPDIEQIKRDRCYQVSDAAHALAVSRQTVHRWVDSGRLAVNELMRRRGVRRYIHGWSIIANY